MNGVKNRSTQERHQDSSPRGCGSTLEALSYPISLAHRLTRQLTKVRKDGTLPYLRPDGKSQVSVQYDENGKPLRLEAVVLSTQHDENVTQEQIHADIKKYVFDPVLPADMVDENTKFFINPTGRFVIGGPHGDSGLTGRKIIVDTYGGYARHGGGAFSGKDPTKVDRSAAYAARHIAKNIDAAFTLWLRRGIEGGYLTRRTNRPSDTTHTPEPHRHTMTCEHVQAIMGPEEHLYNHERRGFAPSEWMRACQAQADILNRKEHTS